MLAKEKGIINLYACNLMYGIKNILVKKYF